MKTLAAIALTSAALLAQAPLDFEVASIKPVGPELNAAVTLGIKIDGTQLRTGGLTLRDYLAWAYMRPIAQIEGPDWIASERFEINAKLPDQPDGTAIDDKTMAGMLQRLLESRFALKTHRVSKEFPVYVLAQTRDGIKAKESPLDPESPEGVNVGAAGSNQGTTINFGRGASLSVAGNRLVVTKLDMATLAENLARYMDRPIVDQTGLTSTYGFTVDLTPQDYQAMMVRAATAAGISLPPQALRLLDLPFGDSLHEGLDKVGLKLEQKKVPLEVIVIDSINRAPSEN